jgi:long-chain acyl-CoA synthetase
VSDRKKNIIKTSSGQYVFLQKIEEKLRAHESIDQAMVIGFQRSFLSTLIIPDYKQLKKWCLDKGIHWTAELYMIENDRVKKYFDDIILKINESLKNHEKIKAYTLLAEEWSVDSEEYTPTLKFRRKFIIEKYSKVIDDMYS